MNIREMEENELGKPIDGLPIKGGDKFKMISGRITTPFPKSTRELNLQRWLAENVMNEAIASNDDFNEPIFSLIKDGLAPSKKADRISLSPSDMDMLNMYLWAYQPTPVRSIFKD